MTIPLLGPLKILCIEDDADSRRVVERLPRAEGYDVYLADDGLAALELAANPANAGPDRCEHEQYDGA